MATTVRAAPRRLFIPEAIQTSEMDCGPAALKALLEGFYIPTSYGRLREACQTSVDGTSIDTLEKVAVQLGLAAEQIMLPADHLLLAETRALPALVVVRAPGGLTHFLIAWNCYANWVQVMDPGAGRRWVTRRTFLDTLFIHTHSVTFEKWREWVSGAGFLNPLRRRMSALRVPPAAAEEWIARAAQDPGWYNIALLDATVRMTTALVRAGGIRPGAEATRTIERIWNAPGPQRGMFVPPNFWSVTPAPGEGYAAPHKLLFTGALIIRALRRRAVSEALPEDVPPLPPELEAALHEPPARPELAVIDALRADGLLTPTVLMAALGLATLGVLIQGLLFQGILQIATLPQDRQQQLGVLAAVLLFMFALFAVELPISQIIQRIGRRLETRLRVRFLEKIPRLGDSYFKSRLTSDMVQRAHSLRQLHTLPEVGVNLLRTGFQLILTTLGVIWLEPGSAPLALAATGMFMLVAYITRPLLQERDLRVRSQVGALSRFYLDGLLGLIPLKLHGAERGYRREYEGLLTEWARANRDLANASIYLQGLSALLYSGFSVWLVYDYVTRHGTTTGTLLLFFWVLSLPMLASTLVQTAQQYPMLRNLILRMLEPLGAPEEGAIVSDSAIVRDSAIVHKSDSAIVEKPADGTSIPLSHYPTTARPHYRTIPLSIEYQNVSVQAGGHTILHEINLTIRAGEHVAIVGPSGAGKSSLVGVLLGWRTPSSGECRVDGVVLEGARLAQLRRELVWVDPDVQLWNQTLWDNVQYGNTPQQVASTGRAIEYAELLDVLERLDKGAQTVLGEGGGLLSGGEGQRVRLARAMNRAGVRLALLDEPFRGLDRETRRRMLARAREFWREATLLCVTHDVGETRAFERVLVIEQGRIVEDAPPDQLAADPNSRYRALLDSEDAVRRGLWEGAHWRRWWIENGELRTETAVPETQIAAPETQTATREIQPATPETQTAARKKKSPRSK